MVFFECEIVEVSFRVGDHDQIHFFALVTDFQRCLFIELCQFGPRTRDGDFYFAIVSRDFLSLSGKPLQPLAFRLDHADKQGDAHNTEHEGDVA
jgi:hypothetical protein